MSILLEALKKSERQRQLGQTPTLQTGVEGHTSSPLSLNHWIPLSLIALSACVMIWFGWLQFRKPEQPNTETVAANVAKAGERRQPRTLTETFQADGEDLDASASKSPAASPESEDGRARLSQSVSNFTRQSDETDGSQQTSDLAADTIQASEPLAEAEPTRTRSRQAEAEPEVESDPSELQPHVSEPISYWELPQGVRDNLPEIKITVLVYSEEPNDRFLLTNGQRLTEKEELQNGVVLDEIRRDGAVFLYRNYRFLVKG